MSGPTASGAVTAAGKVKISSRPSRNGGRQFIKAFFSRKPVYCRVYAIIVIMIICALGQRHR